jgi:hypothetical protein
MAERDIPADLAWVKSTFSDKFANCVEVASLPGGGVAMRNGREPDGPALKFTEGEWQAFLGGVGLGEFDHFGR